MPVGFLSLITLHTISECSSSLCSSKLWAPAEHGFLRGNHAPRCLLVLQLLLRPLLLVFVREGGVEADAVAAGIPRPQQARRREGEAAPEGQEEEGEGGLAACGGEACDRGRSVHHIAKHVLAYGGDKRRRRRRRRKRQKVHGLTIANFKHESSRNRVL